MTFKTFGDNDAHAGKATDRLTGKAAMHAGRATRVAARARAQRPRFATPAKPFTWTRCRR